MVELTSIRIAELESNLTVFQSRLAEVAASCNRNVAEIDVIAVTKGFPVSDISILHNLGITQIGESKDQEIQGKLASIAGLKLQLHFIGQLQRNKVKRVCSYSSVIHSVDRMELISAIAAAKTAGLELPKILLQVDLAEKSQLGRGGARPAELKKLATAAIENGLTVQGLMAVAPLSQFPVKAFTAFNQIANEFQMAFPNANWRSIGMSADWEIAVAHGATHLRIGSALLGNRG